VIAVNYAVARHLGREPTHAGLVATQRAARRLTERYQIRIAHISSDRVTSRGAAVIAREDQRITDGQLVQAAKKRLPELGEQPPSPIADQLIDELASALAPPRPQRAHSPPTTLTTHIATTFASG
jgi:hypothetical protein